MTQVLENYKPASLPVLDQPNRPLGLYLKDQLAKVSNSIGSILGYVQTTYTVAKLPASPFVGQTAFVTDATATTFASAVVGGGTNKVPVYFDGAWKIG